MLDLDRSPLLSNQYGIVNYNTAVVEGSGRQLLVVVGKRGWLGSWLQSTFGINLIFTWQGAVIAATIVAFPLILKSARSAFEAVDPQLEQAARVLGLGEWAVFFRVTLPMAWPPLPARRRPRPAPRGPWPAARRFRRSAQTGW